MKFAADRDIENVFDRVIQEVKANAELDISADDYPTVESKRKLIKSFINSSEDIEGELTKAGDSAVKYLEKIVKDTKDNSAKDIITGIIGGTVNGMLTIPGAKLGAELAVKDPLPKNQIDLRGLGGAIIGGGIPALLALGCFSYFIGKGVIKKN